MGNFDDSPLDEAFEPTVVEEPQEELRLETQGLLQVGFLTSDVNIGTHTVSIRTLRIGEEFEAALLAKKYEDTVEAGRALATSLVAAAITRVDGEALIGEALTPGDLALEARFQYVLDNWYWPPIERVYREYSELVGKVGDAYDNLGKA